MGSPFRDDDLAAGRTLEELTAVCDELSRRVARKEHQLARSRVQTWMWALRLIVLGVTFGAACFIGYHSSTDQRGSTCEHERAWR
jgi:hypothetical protein